MLPFRKDNTEGFSSEILAKMNEEFEELLGRLDPDSSYFYDSYVQLQDVVLSRYQEAV
jgi:hypothetical protein